MIMRVEGVILKLFFSYISSWLTSYFPIIIIKELD